MIMLLGIFGVIVIYYMIVCKDKIDSIEENEKIRKYHE